MAKAKIKKDRAIAPSDELTRIRIMPEIQEAIAAQCPGLLAEGLAHAANALLADRLGVPQPETPTQRKSAARRLPDGEVKRNSIYQRNRRQRRRQEASED